jgi:NADPH:quinone reductase-like Zn-dependent oxidoreductase
MVGENTRAQARRMIERRSWIIPALLLLTAVPIAAGVVRLLWLAGGPEVLPADPRFLAAPLPIALHIFGLCAWCLGGAFQFSTRLRQRGWHRAAGRVLVGLGLIGVLSGMWITFTYPPVEHDSSLLTAIRVVVAAAMVTCLLLGFAAIRRRDIAQHRAWMIRGYALAVAAGTQVFTLLPYTFVDALHDEMGRALTMGTGWAINLVVAEWIVRRGAPHTAARTPMRAIVQDGYGSPHRVLAEREIERPPVGDDDVLVRVAASSVNTPDWIATTGVPYAIRLQFGLRQPPSPVRGTDLAGVVEAVGRNVTDLHPGDAVFGSTWNGSSRTVGTFADYTVAPAARVVRKPASVSFEDAAASVMSGLTALAAMRHVEPGMRVLINGASGGVGVFAVQIAKLRGANVTGVCSTRNVELVRSLGADHIIEYTHHDFTRGDRRWDVILDNVLNHSPRAVARVLTPNGFLIPNSVGNTGGVFAGLPRMAFAALMGVFARNVRLAACDPTREHLAELAELLASGKVRVVVGARYPMIDAAKAIDHMLTHRARGKIVLFHPHGSDRPM